MRRYVLSLLVVLAAFASLGASYRTRNFDVEAADKELAQKIGDRAEAYRKEFALKWLGEEMPAWGRRCPIKVTVTSNGTGGATTFAFDNGHILSISMHMEGNPDRLIASVLPHEITHTVLAHHFRKPLPRWADEGGAILSEDERECLRHKQHVWNILQTPGRAMPLRRLFNLRQYPPDVMVLYAQGYSVSRFLVEARDHQSFLAFVAAGMEDDWDKACEKHYAYKNVEQMEAAWVKWVRAEKRKRERTTVQQRLEKQVELLQLENQLLQLQLKQERQAAETKQEQDRVKAKIRRARRALKQLQEETKPASSPSSSKDSSGSSAFPPILPAPAPAVPVPAEPPPIAPPPAR